MQVRTGGEAGFADARDRPTFTNPVPLLDEYGVQMEIRAVHSPPVVDEQSTAGQDEGPGLGGYFGAGENALIGGGMQWWVARRFVNLHPHRRAHRVSA